MSFHRFFMPIWLDTRAIQQFFMNLEIVEAFKSIVICF